MDKPAVTTLDRTDYYPDTEIVKKTYAPVVLRDGVAQSSDFSKSALQVSYRDSQGWRAPTNYSAYYRDVMSWRGSFSEWDVGSVDRLSRSSPTPFSRLISVDEDIPEVTYSVKQRALIECLLKIKDQRINYSVALAQVAESADLIGNAVMRLALAYDAARSRKWKKVLQHLSVKSHTFKASSKDTSGRWLELQYGWLPFLSDVYNVYEDSRLGVLRWENRISATKVVKVPLPNKYTKKVEYGLTARYEQMGSAVGCRVRLDYILDDVLLRSASAAGLLNPVEVAWELVPFSFVADWIVPVGDWLSAMDADVGTIFKGGTTTSFQKITRVGKILYAGTRYKSDPSTGVRVGLADLSCGVRISSVSRSIFTQSPTPSLYVKNPLSAGHVANAIALLVSTVTRR